MYLCFGGYYLVNFEKKYKNFKMDNLMKFSIVICWPYLVIQYIIGWIQGFTEAGKDRKDS